MMSPWERRVSNVGKSVTDDRGRTQCTGSRLQIAFVSRGVSKGAEQTVVRCVTPDPKLLLLASAWRARAKEILLRAETNEGRGRPGGRCAKSPRATRDWHN